jgi:hypothetical protein
MKSRKKRKSNIVVQFIEFINMVKMFHWQTEYYSKHKITDDLYKTLNEQTDKYVEILFSKKLILNFPKTIAMVTNLDNAAFQQKVEKFKNYLISLNYSKEDSDLQNLRDDILGSLNQFNYLFKMQS